MPTPTPHNEAKAGDIADAVLLPGDPLRAQVIAEQFLENPICYNRVRNMFGFTGTYKGRRVSVQGTGMGMPSSSIYVTELLRFYGARTAIRVGSCGAMQSHVQLRDIVIAQAAHTNSSMNRRIMGDVDYASAASFDLVRAASDIATARSIRAHVGTIYSSDSFYDDNEETVERLARYGTLAVEMECAALYRIAAGEGARALCIATVSDHLVTKEVLPTAERQHGFMQMVEVALETLLATSTASGRHL